MSDEFDRFLASGPQTLKERDQVAQQARERAEAEEAAKRERRKHLESQWLTCRAALQSVIDRINDAFKEAGLELIFLDEREGPPAIAELTIGVRRERVSVGNNVMLNVTGTGAQEVMFNYTSSPGRPNKTELPDIERCGGEQYAQMLMSFLQPLLHRL